LTYKIDFEPIGRRIPCIKGDTIFDAAKKVGIPLVSFCGGRTTCGRCKIRVVSGWAIGPDDSDPKAIENNWDRDAESLYMVLENEIIPT